MYDTACLTESALVGFSSGTTDVLPTVLDHQTQLAAGALLMLLNSGIVAGIGQTVLPVSSDVCSQWRTDHRLRWTITPGPVCPEARTKRRT